MGPRGPEIDPETGLLREDFTEEERFGNLAKRERYPTRDKMKYQLSPCIDCGAVVDDDDKHDEFHNMIDQLIASLQGDGR